MGAVRMRIQTADKNITIIQMHSTHHSYTSVRKCYYGLWTHILARSNSLNTLMHLLLANTQLFALQDVNLWTGEVWITCGLLWCFYQLFGLSFWRHPFTAEDPLLSKWCNATFLQICSDKETHFIRTVYIGWLWLFVLLCLSSFHL